MNRDKFNSDPLRYVLNLAYQQAMTGKGRDRHVSGSPVKFRDQVWASITRAVGIGFPLGQALKKTDETKALERDAAIRELLGAIVYVAMAIIEMMNENKD